MKATNVFNKLAGMGTTGAGLYGNYKTDVERVMSHYKVNEETAKQLIVSGKAKLPKRGTGLENAKS